MKRRTAILISGRGSNMAALIRAAADPGFPAAIVRVISNRADARGLALAAAAGIPTLTITSSRKDREEHEREVEARLRSDRVELVCLAGYLRVLSAALVGRWRGRILNIHPSLLPAFPGLDTHRRALAAGVKLHGCTVHVVTERLDDGPILAQAAVPVLPGDTAEELAARVLTQEHRVYPLALAAFAGQDTRAASADAALDNPVALVPSATIRDC